MTDDCANAFDSGPYSLGEVNTVHYVMLLSIRKSLRDRANIVFKPRLLSKNETRLDTLRS